MSEMRYAVSSVALEQASKQAKHELFTLATRLYSKKENVPVPNKLHALLMNVYFGKLYSFVENTCDSKDDQDSVLASLLSSKQDLLNDLTSYVHDMRIKNQHKTLLSV